LESSDKIRRKSRLVTGILIVVGVFLVAAAITIRLLPGTVHYLVLNGTAHGSPKAQVPPSDRYDLLSLRTADGVRISAQFGKAESPEGAILPNYSRRPTAIYCYPGGGYLKWSHTQFEGLRRLGWNVIMPEYPGYGLSDGRPSEAGCYAAAEAAYLYATSRQDLDSAQIVGVGWSLGAASVTDVATRHNLAGLVLIGAVTNLPDGVRNIAKGRPPISLIPDKWLAGAAEIPKLDNLTKLSRSRCRVLIICGASDAIVSPVMAHSLASAAPGRSTQKLIEGAGHFDLFRHSEREVWDAISVWARAAGL
jgi:pimeloyl-ACP methyl ester carboxylesterase